MHNKTADPMVLAIITAAIAGILFTGSFISIQEPNTSNYDESNHGEVLGVSDRVGPSDEFSDLSLTINSIPSIPDLASTETEAADNFVSLQINDTRSEQDWNLQIEYGDIRAKNSSELYFGDTELLKLEKNIPMNLISSAEYKGSEVSVDIESKVVDKKKLSDEKVNLILTLF